MRSPTLSRGAKGWPRARLCTSRDGRLFIPDRDRLCGLLVGLCCSNLTAVGAIVSPALRVARAAMGKHLTADELDRIQQWRVQGLSATEMFRRLQHARTRSGGSGPNLTTVRRALRGRTHKRSRVETRGRKRILSPANVRELISTQTSKGM